MSKKCYRYFGAFMGLQEKWLNKMAGRGYRLIRAGKMLYEFEKSGTGLMQYCVEFIGHKAGKDAEEYRSFLKDLGYQVFDKNVNLNYSVGKVRVRPWADAGGQVSTNLGKNGTYNREILIVGKKNDGRPFELHTTLEDKVEYNRILQKPWFFLFVLLGILAVWGHSYILGTGAVLSLVAALIYQIHIVKLRRVRKIEE